MKNKTFLGFIALSLLVITIAAVQFMPEMIGLGAVGAGGVKVAVLTGFVRTCGLQSGGGKKIWLVEVADLTSFTLATEVYTTATMVASKIFKQYEFDPDTCEIKEDVAVDNNCMKVTHGLEFYITKMSATARAAVSEIALASACGLIAIAEDNNGVKWVLGYSENHTKLRPMLLKTAAGSSGKKLTDANGYTVKLECENNEMMRTFSGTVPIT